MACHTVFVTSDAPPPPKTTAERSRRAREKRRGRGETQIIAWVPAERASFARQLLQRVLAGANTLPPDPEQAAAIADLQARVMQLDAALTVAKADLETARSQAAIDAKTLADATARATSAAADLAAERATTRRYRPPGWRGRLIGILIGILAK